MGLASPDPCRYTVAFLMSRGTWWSWSQPVCLYWDSPDGCRQTGMCLSDSLSGCQLPKRSKSLQLWLAGAWGLSGYISLPALASTGNKPSSGSSQQEEADLAVFLPTLAAFRK